MTMGASVLAPARTTEPLSLRQRQSLTSSSPKINLGATWAKAITNIIQPEDQSRSYLGCRCLDQAFPKHMEVIAVEALQSPQLIILSPKCEPAVLQSKDFEITSPINPICYAIQVTKRIESSSIKPKFLCKLVQQCVGTVRIEWWTIGQFVPERWMPLFVRINQHTQFVLPIHDVQHLLY
jgi:hypothetical protein